MARRDFIVPSAIGRREYLRTQLPGTFESCGVSRLIKLMLMTHRTLFRFLLLAALGLVAGFLALTLAELLTPGTHKSIAWTFGWFLRIAIAANAAFYYAIFALATHFAVHRRTR